MEITISKKGLKKTLAVLMAMIIALSSVWIGLGVVGFAVAEYELEVGSDVKVTASDERSYIRIKPEQTCIYMLEGFYLRGFEYGVLLFDENKDLIKDLSYEIGISEGYIALNLSADEVYYIGVDFIADYYEDDAITFKLYSTEYEIFENEAAINVYVAGGCYSYIKFIPKKSGLYDFSCEDVYDFSGEFDVISKSLWNENKDTKHIPELKNFYKLEAEKTYYMKLISNDLDIETVAASVSFVGTDIGFCGDDVYWIFDENTGELVIGGEGEMEYSTYDQYKESIKSVVVEEGVTSICYSAFSNCTSLENVIIPEGVTSIDDYTFSGCTSLENIIIPEGVTSIGDSAFSGCEKIENIKLPDSVESIDWYCFADCIGLTRVELPENLKELADSAFEGCINITEYIVDESNGSFSVDENGVLFNKDKTTLLAYPVGNTRTAYEIPEGVICIGCSAFENCNYLVEVEIPESVVKIDDSAFAFCSSLVRAEIPESVVEICWSAFRDSTALISVEIPGSVDSIEGYAFYRCASIENIVINEGVTAIGMYAFAGCDNITQVTIPGSVSKMESYAFGFCKSLKNVIINEGVTSIGSSVFSGCTRLESIVLPEGVVKIGSRAFSGCSALNNIIIPGSITTIDFEAFVQCDSLTDIYYMGTETEWNEIAINKNPGAPFLNATVHFLGETECAHQNKVSYAQQDATCTENGYTAGVYCPDCEKWLSGHKVIEAGHSEVTYTQNASCTVNGYKLTSCSACGEQLDYEIIAAEGHKLGDWKETKAATCLEKGEETISCTLCSYSEKRETAALGHSWNSWSVSGEATLMNAGEKTRSCSRCRAEEKESIPRLEGEVSEDAYSGVKVEYTDSSYDGERMQVVVEEDFTGSQYLGQSYGNFVSWNIKTYVNGLEVQPDAPVLVTIPIPSAFNKNMIVVYHVDSVSGKLEKISPVVIEGNNITFLADSFSVYMVVDESTAQEKDPSENCSCNCHKTGFMGFIWKIIRIFLKLFKANPVCACGTAHY